MIKNKLSKDDKQNLIDEDHELLKNLDQLQYPQELEYKRFLDLMDFIHDNTYVIDPEDEFDDELEEISLTAEKLKELLLTEGRGANPNEVIATDINKILEERI